MTRRRDQVSQYLQDVGGALRQARTARGLTVADLADMAAVSVRQIISIEGGSNTSLATVARLCLALRIAPEHLPVPRALVAQTLRVVTGHLGLSLPGPARRRRGRGEA